MRTVILSAVLLLASACAPRQDPGIPIPPPVPDNPTPVDTNDGAAGISR